MFQETMEASACQTGLNTINKLESLLPCPDSQLTVLSQTISPDWAASSPPLCCLYPSNPMKGVRSFFETQSRSSFWHAWSPVWHPSIRKCGPHQTGPKFLNVWERKGQALYTDTWRPWAKPPLLILSYSDFSPWHTGICIISIFKKVQCWLSGFVVFTGVMK